MHHVEADKDFASIKIDPEVLRAEVAKRKWRAKLVWSMKRTHWDLLDIEAKGF